MLAFAACLEPQLAHADRTAAPPELASVRSEPPTEREARFPTPDEPSRTAAAAPPASDPAAAESPTLELRVSYRAPRECPSSGAFLAALQQHVAAGGGGAIDADVAIARAGASQFELVLRLHVAGQNSESVTRAESCLALVQLAALNAGMARTTTLSERSLLAAPPPSPELEPSSRPGPTLPLEAASAVEGDTNDPTAPREPGFGLRGLRPFVLGEVRAQSGLLPRQSWGRGVAAGVTRGMATLRLSATFWQSQRAGFSPDGASEVSLGFQQRSLELAPCAGGGGLGGMVRIDACALLAAHQVRTDEQGSQLTGSVGASALATLRPWRGLRIELEGGLSAAVNRPMFGVQSDAYLYQPGVLQPGARLALGWEFGGGT